jgi:hypothetical protein
VVLTRVNSTNVQYEGLRIGGVGHQMNSKINQSNKVVSRVNVVVNLACFHSVPRCPLLAPIYRWPGLKEWEGSDTHYNSGIRHELVFRVRLQLGLSLTGLRGTQLTGSIIYTLVSSSRDSTRIADSGWISDLQIFDLINLLTSSPFIQK